MKLEETKQIKDNQFEECIRCHASSAAIKGDAGCGKTYSMLQRIHLLHHEDHVPFKNMMNLCTNRNDADYALLQYKQMFEEEDSYPAFTTIYNLCFAIIKKYNDEAGIETFRPYKDLSSIVSTIVKKAFAVSLSYSDLQTLMQKIAHCKTMMMSEREIQSQTLENKNLDFAYIYTAYEKEKAKKKIFDYEDLLIHAFQILATRHSICTFFRKACLFMHIDDAQNLPFCAYLIIKALQEEDSQLRFYYDINQCTLNRHGAFPNALLSLESTFPSIQHFYLQHCYRNSLDVYRTAAKFMKKEPADENCESDQKDTVTFKGFQESEELYAYAKTKAENAEEILFVARDMELLAPLADALSSASISFSYNGNIAAFTKNETVKDFMHFFSLLSNPRDLVSFQKIAEKIKIKLTERVVNEIADIVNKNPKFDVYQAAIMGNTSSAVKNRIRDLIEGIRAAQEFNTTQMMNFIIHKLNYKDYMKTQNIKENDSIMIALYTLAKRYPAVWEMDSHLRSISNLILPKSASVILSTVDEVKARSCHEVCFLDCMEGILLPDDQTNEREKIYHVMTRAEEKLEFCFARKCASISMKPAAFLAEIYEKKEVPVTVELEKEKEENLFKEGTRIRHKTLGEGMIVKTNNNMAKVAFDNNMTKTINLIFCMERNLLQII